MVASFIEGFGEKILSILEIFIDQLKGLFNAVMNRFTAFEEANIYPIFKSRGIEVKDYIIFKLQIASALFLIFSTLFIVDIIRGRTFLILGGIFLLFNLYLIKKDIKKSFEDYPAYRDFFLSYYGLALILILVKIKKPVVRFGFPYLHFAAIAIVGALVIFIYFNKTYSRDHTFGRVLREKGLDVDVKVTYDIRANVKPQVVTLRNEMNARVGDRVKLRVEKGFFSFRGNTPREMIGVEWE